MSLRADTPEAREIWATVEAVAARTPEWLREMVKRKLADYNTPEAVAERRKQYEYENSWRGR